MTCLTMWSGKLAFAVTTCIITAIHQQVFGICRAWRATRTKRQSEADYLARLAAIVGVIVPLTAANAFACQTKINGTTYEIALGDSRCLPSGSSGAIFKCIKKPNGEFDIELVGRCPVTDLAKPSTDAAAMPTTKPAATDPAHKKKPIVGDVPPPSCAAPPCKAEATASPKDAVFCDAKRMELQRRYDAFMARCYTRHYWDATPAQKREIAHLKATCYPESDKWDADVTRTRDSCPSWGNRKFKKGNRGVLVD